MAPKHLFFTQDHLTKVTGPVPSNPHVRVRGTTPVATFDAVWINGERSYDTYVIKDGRVTYHSPVESVGSASFDAHERMGTGSPV